MSGFLSLSNTIDGNKSSYNPPVETLRIITLQPLAINFLLIINAIIEVPIKVAVQ